jgi:hypothetical protein
MIGWVHANTELCGLDARAVASTVEEKIFKTNLTYLATGLIKQFVLAEVAELIINSKSLNIPQTTINESVLADSLVETVYEEEYVMA